MNSRIRRTDPGQPWALCTFEQDQLLPTGFCQVSGWQGVGPPSQWMESLISHAGTAALSEAPGAWPTSVSDGDAGPQLGVAWEAGACAAQRRRGARQLLLTSCLLT